MEPLDSAEVRVLGSLLEKEATTPEYYPLTLNALVSACNQKSNREPVVNYTANDVSDAALRLRDKKLLEVITGSGRVSKYAQRISEALNLGRRESAVLCTLLLRGPQTLGEIKDRSERMHAFADLAEVEGILENLSGRSDAPLVSKLVRQAGQKEPRYAHLLAGEPTTVTEAENDAVPSSSRLDQLTEEVQQLRTEVNELRKRFDEFQR